MLCLTGLKLSPIPNAVEFVLFSLLRKKKNTMRQKSIVQILDFKFGEGKLFLPGLLQKDILTVLGVIAEFELLVTLRVDFPTVPSISRTLPDKNTWCSIGDG